jgi:exodeoxyribonuclease VII large subunit
MRAFIHKDPLLNESKPSERRVYSVSEVTREIKMTLEEGFPSLWIEGEISNFKKHSSGHSYFSLKDSEAQISCVMWRGRSQNLIFDPVDGLKVLVFGSLTVYERQGRYQVDVVRLQPAGVGELQMAFEILKRRLEEEGLFDPEHKKTLPAFPERIGVVTSPTGAAIRDIVSVIQRRFPSVRIILRPVRVQGEGAAREIADAIREFNEYGEIDVLIVGRGGGSLEDLWAFNEEIVVRAVFESEIPIISAVGHEIDFSLSDFAADVRAPTPSAAAELVVKNRDELLQTIDHSITSIKRSIQDRIQFYRDRILRIEKSYGFRWPADRIREFQMRLDDTLRKLETGQLHRFGSIKAEIDQLTGRLKALDPQSVMERGYSITSRLRDGTVVKCSMDVQEKEAIRIRFAQGSVLGEVEEIEEEGFCNDRFNG